MNEAIAVAVFATIVGQTAMRSLLMRVLCMLTGLVVVCSLAAVHGKVLTAATAIFPGNVLVLVVSLAVLSRIFQVVGIPETIARAILRWTKGHLGGVFVLFAAGMFLVSATMNNLAAMLLVLPVLLSILRVLEPPVALSTLLLATLLPICNLGGAATPIGDFPAIILFSSEGIRFMDYLIPAFLSCAALAVVLFALLVGPSWAQIRTITRDLRTRDVAALLETHMANDAAHRWWIGERVTFTAILLLMLVAWAADVLPPDEVAIIGVSLAVVLLALFELIKRRRFGAMPTSDSPVWAEDLDPYAVGPLLESREAPTALARAVIAAAIDVIWTASFFFALFMMVSVVQATGLLAQLGHAITALDLGATTTVLLFVGAVSVATAIFSAGPGMAMALPVARSIYAIEGVSRDGLLVAIALGVCAGSCLWLSSATSGPLLQTGVARAGLASTSGGEVVHLGFRSYLMVGVLSYVVILAGAAVFIAVHVT